MYVRLYETKLLYQRGIQVSHETLREWCIKFSAPFAEELRHRKPRRGSRWHLDEVWILSANSDRQQRTPHFEGPLSSHACRNTADFEFADSIRCVRALMASDIGYGVQWTSTGSCSKFCCNATATPRPRRLRALANLATGAQVIGPLALTLIGLFFCQSRAEVILGVQTSLLSLFGLSFSDSLL